MMENLVEDIIRVVQEEDVHVVHVEVVVLEQWDVLKEQQTIQVFNYTFLNIEIKKNDKKEKTV